MTRNRADDLEQRLLQIISAQQHSRQRDFWRKDPHCLRLLETLRDGLSAPIDLFYVLDGGKVNKVWFMDYVFDDVPSFNLEPHCLDYEAGKVKPLPDFSWEDALSEDIDDVNPVGFALVADDAWESGWTTRRTVGFLEHAGYKRDNIFLFYYKGSCSRDAFNSGRYGFVNQNPVLVKAQTMLEFFEDPSRYR